MPVKAVLFDLFDTLLLLESDEIYYEPCLRKMHAFLTQNRVDVSFEDFSRVYFEVRDKFYSESRESLEEPHFNVRVSQTLQRLGYNFDFSDRIVAGATMAFAKEFMRYVQPDTDAINVLQELRRSYRLGLVSNFGIPECGRKLLEKFGLKKYLDVVVISGEVNRRKPSPEIFERALRTLGVAASEAVFVGDMMDLDVKGPKSVGIKAILIQRRPMKGVVDVKPDRVIRSLAELPAMLENLTERQ
jgi:HAD superfamily hydrolase (TIGR01549 family)